MAIIADYTITLVLFNSSKRLMRLLVRIHNRVLGFLPFALVVQLEDSMFKSYHGGEERGDNIQLPDTVTKLLTPYRSTVYVVGTAHFSENSQEDVRKVYATYYLLNIVRILTYPQ